MVDDIRNLQLMGRRRFLSTVAALGASAGAVAGLSQSVMAELIDDPKREVPRLYSYTHANHEAVKDGAVPDRKPVYYKISRDRWRRVESAHDARGRIERRFEDRREPLDVWVTTNSNGEKRIDVDVYDDGSVGRRSVRAIEDALPTAVNGVAGRGTPAAETVRGIPVAVNRIPAASPEPTPVSNDPDYYWEDWDEIPAGAAGRFAITQDSSGDWVYGTARSVHP